LSFKALVLKFEPIAFIEQTIFLISQCTLKQLRFDPKNFRVVCKAFVEKCIDIGQPMRAIKPLKAAIHKISHDDQITPQHYMFILACI